MANREHAIAEKALPHLHHITVSYRVVLECLTLTMRAITYIAWQASTSKRPPGVQTQSIATAVVRYLTLVSYNSVEIYIII